jgi:AraC family transcriptional regulator of adaptative response / DNA-3-methyladenine glycosylase II
MISVRIDLPYDGAYAVGAVVGHLVATSTPGVEEWRDGVYRRTLRAAGGPAIVALRIRPGVVRVRLHLTDPLDAAEVAARCRRLLDLDVPIATVEAALGADPVLAPLVAARPGQRIPGTVDPTELVLKVILGQQVSTSAARTLAARLTERYGERIDDPDGTLSRLFPTPAALADVDPASLPMPRRRADTLLRVARLLADGAVPLTDPPAARAVLSQVSGIGPWTLDLVAMRGLGDPDVFPAGDLGVRKALADLPGADPSRWRPWRSYATQHLWASLDHEVNRLA